MLNISQYTMSPPNPNRRSRSSERDKHSANMTRQMQEMEKRISEMAKQLSSAKAQLAQRETSRSPSVSPTRTASSSRRRTSRSRPRKDNEPEEAIDLDAPKSEVDWATVNRVIQDYQETKDAEANSVLAAEEPTHSMSDDKIKERRQLRVKHRALLMTCQELDDTMEIAEDPPTTSWSSSSTRPVSSVETAEVVLPPIARNYLHPSILQDIRVTGERAFSTNKATTKKTPLRLDVLPKDERCFTTSWLPADDKLFPQAHLSDESVIRLHRDLVK
jgi:hypothetical protein